MKNQTDLKRIFLKLNNLCIEIIEINRGTLQSDVREEISIARGEFNEVKLQIDQISKNTLEEMSKKVSRIKDIWVNYFEKYDKVNLSVEKKFEKVNKTFDDWKELVMKPLNNSNARLYAVEIRIKETEDKIFSNFAHSRDILKKLVFALEQENLSNRDSIVTKMLEKSDIDFKVQLHEISKQDTSHSRKTSRDKNMDFLFIKRLLYIKHEIDEFLNETKKEEKSFDYSKPKTPNILLDTRRLSQNHSISIAPQSRLKTVSSKNRRHVFSSMSPLRLLNSKDETSKSKIAMVNFKKNMYSNSLISATEHSVKIINPNHIQNMRKKMNKAKNKLNLRLNHSNDHLMVDYLNDGLGQEDQA